VSHQLVHGGRAREGGAGGAGEDQRYVTSDIVRAGRAPQLGTEGGAGGAGEDQLMPGHVGLLVSTEMVRDGTARRLAPVSA
jgi:hypothetical protein